MSKYQMTTKDIYSLFIWVTTHVSFIFVHVVSGMHLKCTLISFFFYCLNSDLPETLFLIILDLKIHLIEKINTFSTVSREWIEN